MASPVQIDFDALAKQHGGQLAEATPPPEAATTSTAPAPSRPAGVYETLAAEDEANRAAIAGAAGEWSAEHPIAAGAIAAAATMLTGGGMQAGRAMAMAKSAAARATAMAKSMGSAAAPMVKYEIAKQVLERLGLPASVAAPAAMILTGRGQKAPAAAPPAPAAAAAPAPVPAAAPAPMPQPAPAVVRSPSTIPARVTGTPPATPAAAVASPLASPPAVSASPVPPAVPVSGPGPTPAPAPLAQGPPAVRPPSPQRIQNELGLASRRSGANLSDVEYQEAAKLVQAGRTPAEAVMEIQVARGAGTGTPAGQTAPVPAPAPAAVQPPPDLPADEVKEFVRLLKIGKSPAQAVALLEKQRAAARALGIPTPAQVRHRVAERNATGRWSEDK